jgi:hypothetical protein
LQSALNSNSAVDRTVSNWPRSSRSVCQQGRLLSPAVATIVPSNGPGRASFLQTGPQQACCPSMCRPKTAPTGLWASPPSCGSQLTKAWDAFTEYAGDFPQAGEPRHLPHFGTAYKITPQQQLDLHLGVGLSAAAADHFVGIGYSFSFRMARG